MILESLFSSQSLREPDFIAKRSEPKLASLAYWVILFVFSVLVSFQLTSFPFSGNLPGTDSGVFLYIGDAINSGQTPYIDVFDHKGPMIYFINAAGLSLSETYGVWLLEFTALLISVVFCFKTLIKTTPKIVSLLTTVLIFVFLREYLQGGNLVEVYAMPMVFITFCMFTDYFVGKKDLTCGKMFLAGVLFGLTFLLRPNLVELWVAFCPVIFVDIAISEKKKALLKYLAGFIGGIILAVAPFIIYLYAKSALGEFLYQFFSFNVKYSFSLAKGLEDRVRAFLFFAYTPLFGLCISFFVLAAIFFSKLPRKLSLYYLACFLFLLVCFLSISITGNRYEHYAMVLIACYAVPLSAVIMLVFSELSVSFKSKRIVFFAVMIMGFAFITEPLFSFSSRSAKSVLAISRAIGGKMPSLDGDFVEAIKAIKGSSQADDLITVYGNDCKVYTYSGRKSVSRYIYQFPISSISHNIAEEYIQDVREGKPAIIVISLKRFQNRDNYAQAFVLDSLEEIISDGYNSIYESDEYLIYRRLDL